jgi:hypothetical protein
MNELTAYEMAALRIKCMNMAHNIYPVKHIDMLLSEHERLCLTADIFLDYALGKTEKTDEGRYSIQERYLEIKQSLE